MYASLPNVSFIGIYGQPCGAKKPPKPAILANFQVWGSYVPTPFPTKAKFGLRKWTYGVLYHAKFYRHVHIILPP